MNRLLKKELCKWKIRIWKESLQHMSTWKYKLKWQWNTLFAYYYGWNPKHWEHKYWRECREKGILISLLWEMQNYSHCRKARWKMSIWESYIVCDSKCMIFWKAKTKEDIEKSVVFSVGGEREGWIHGKSRNFSAVKLLYMVLKL